MRKAMLAVLLLPLTAAGADRTEELLGAARAALGGEAVQKVQGLRLSGELSRSAGEGDVSGGEIEIDLLRDGRYRKVETVSPVPGVPAISIGAGFDGQEGWVGPLGGPSAGPVVVRMGDAGAPDAAERLRKRMASEAARLAAALLLESPAGCPLEYHAAGAAEAADGKADVLDVKGACGLEARLFLDAASHRPLMIEYTGSLPRMMARRGPQPEGPHTPPPPPPPQQLRLHLDEYRDVKGVQLPHRLSLEADGKTFEEWTVKKWALDPKTGDDHFRKPR
jgi:hypothetical protein